MSSAAPDTTALPGVTVAEHRLHPAYLILGAGQAIRSLIPVIALAVWKSPWWSWIALGALIAVGAVLAWWRRTYQVQDRTLRVRSGIVRRTVTTVPISRITALETHRGLVQRILGVSALRVQTPGDGEHSSVHLSCLSPARLTEVRAALSPGANRPGGGPPDAVPVAVRTSDARVGSAAEARAAVRRHWAGETPPAESARTIAVLGRRELILAAVTGVSVPLVVAGGAAVWSRAQEYLPEVQRKWLQHEVFGRGAVTVLVLAGLLALALAVAVVTTSLRLAGFTLLRDGDRLRTTRGLLSQRTASVAVERIQAVRVVESFWRRRLGLCEVMLEVSGVNGRDSAGRVLFPIVARSGVADLLARALPELGDTAVDLEPVPARSRRRYATRPLLTAAGLTGAAFLLMPGDWAWLAVLPLPVAVQVAVGRAADAGWHVDPRLSVFRWRRITARHTVIARTTRVQYTSQRTTWFAQRAGLRGVQIALSSRRTAGIAYLERVDADAALHRIGRRRRLVVPATS
jgi:putative membrane protein